jgi:pilus assembly protein CpaE
MVDSDKIRILIVDDNPETRENIRKLLQFESDVEVVGAARSGVEGLDLAGETQPDVILMDINMPDMDGIQATEAIRKKIPFTQIVILSVQNDPKYMQRAMMAGARAFLSKPPTVDELISTIHQVGKMAAEEKAKIALVQKLQSGSGGKFGAALTHGKVITVYGPKGGVGTTTIATNLAVALQGPESKVVIVDGNLQYGDVAVFHNEQPRNTILDLTPRASELDTDIIDEVLILHEKSGVHILAAPPRPEMAEQVNPEQFIHVIKFLKTIYNYIVIDTETHLTETVISALDASDVIVLVVTQEIPAIKNAKSFLTLIDQFQIGRARVICIMNKNDKRISLLPERVGESLKQEVVAVIPLEEKIVVNSVNSGVPFMVDNKIQPIGKAISGLVETIKEKINKSDSSDFERSLRK